MNRYTTIINYFKNKEKIMTINFMEGVFFMLQRFFVLVFLWNTVLVNNVFSLFYVMVARYLFLQPPSIRNLKLLNSFSIFAICFQYVLLLLNYVPNQDDLPPQIRLQPIEFSVIQRVGLTDEYWLSYLGFNSGAIENCTDLGSRDSLFQNEYCQSNRLLNWVFVVNTVVISLIYSYFLILEWITKGILKQSLKMERDSQMTQAYVRMQLKTNSNIIINYNTWKNRSYKTKNGIIMMLTRNSHIFLMALILVLAQTNRIIFNFIEMLMGLVFFMLVELIYKWPYLKSKRDFILKYFKLYTHTHHQSL